MGKPFRINPSAEPAKKDQGVAAPPAGKPVVHSRQTGDPLPTGDADTPSHSPRIPWPQPALGVDHKPMKLK